MYEEIKKLYEKLRLEHYRELFGRIREKDGSLSATEAYSADVIYLLGVPTIRSFAEVLGVSQPNATYKINNLAAKGYVTRTVPEEDRREVRVSVADRFFSYYNTDYPFVRKAVETLQGRYSQEEIGQFEKMLRDLNRALEEP